MRSLSSSKKRFSVVPTPQASQGDQREPQRARAIERYTKFFWQVSQNH